MLISTGLVMMMTPALGFFEAGLIRAKNTLSIIMQTFSGLAILSILWFVIGFTLVFAPSQGGFIGNLDWLFFNNVPFNEGLDYAPTIPGVTFASYQMMFAVITPLLITGAFAERMKWSAFFVFIIAWSLLVYYPLAHWIWGRGWLADMGVFDFAGGIVIHTSAGLGSLAAALVLGRRKNFGPDIMVPHNIPLAVIGATLLWVGWFGFNAGSALASGSLAANTLLVTHIGSSTSAIVWIVLSWKRSGKPSTTSRRTSKAGARDRLAGLRRLIDQLPSERAQHVFTHASWASQRTASYERLEFLGDSVLELAVAHALYDRYPDFSEGRLAKIRSHVVSRASCAVVARYLDLGETLVEQAQGLPEDELRRLARNRNVLAALLEAALAALFLEHGFQKIETAIVDAFHDRIEYARTSFVDYKTELQEALAREGRPVTYVVLAAEGPPHDRRFTCAVQIDGEELGVGSGQSKKAAEQEAAQRALERLGIEPATS